MHRMSLFDLWCVSPQEREMSVPVFRFAPSPNGRLHLGHAYSALLNAKMAQEAGGRFLLRIEDTDQTRSRPEFTDAIFEDLAWLGLEWELPVRVQSEHFAEYQTSLERLWRMGVLYPCFCSRKLAAAAALEARDPDGQPLYSGTCRGISRQEATARIATGAIHGWRLNMKACSDADAGMWGDVVIAKRWVGSSYHIAVVTDDAAQGITHVVRGMDMEPATPIHILLQRLLGFPTPHYHHHKLLLDEAGRKLSKSSGSTSIAALRETGMMAGEIRQALGFA
jgi:glutamyl-Q tRNA(Asp) synthetase